MSSIAAANGYTWTTVLVALLNLLVGGLIVTIVRTRPALKKIAADREANLLEERAAEMKEMRERLAKLEEARDNDRKEYEAKRDEERAMHNREIALHRHRFNNLKQEFDAMLLLLKRIPEAEPVVTEVLAMRARHQEAEAAESGSFHAANISGAKP